MILALARRGRVAVAVGLLTSLAAWTAFAQSEDAEAAIRRGMELRKQGQDAVALPYFEKAYKLSRTPRTAAQLGLAQMGLGYWVDAERHLDEALADPDNYWVAKNRTVLDGARTRVHGMVGQIAVTGEPKGAEVLVNGRSVGRLPLGQDLKIGKGPAEIEVRADGYVTATRSLVIAGGGRDQVQLSLEKVAAQPRSVAEARADIPAHESGAAVSPTVEPKSTVPPTDAGRTPLPRVLAWGAAGLAVAALTFGGIETSAMLSKQDEFNGRTVPSPTADDPNRRIPECTTSNLSASCAAIQSSYGRARTLTIVGFVAGGLLAAAAAALFVQSSSGSASSAAESTSPAPRTKLAGLSFPGCAPNLLSLGFVCGARF